MKDVDLIKSLRTRELYYRIDGRHVMANLLQSAADRLEELTKAPEPHPQQLWNTGRKSSEDFND